MKKISLIVVTLLATFAFSSCNKEKKEDPIDPIDPIIEYPYSYFEPYMMWGDTKEEVAQFMSSTYSSWKLDASSSSDQEMQYLDGKYNTINMSYTFKDGKLESSAIAYPMQSDSFQKLKSDIEDNYGVEMTRVEGLGGTEQYYAHSDAKNMDINIMNFNSKKSYYTISAIFKSTGPAPSDKIKFDIEPSNKATLNYTDLTTITLTFPEAKEVSYYDDPLKIEAFSLIGSQGNEIWRIHPDSKQVFFTGTGIKIEVPLSLYEKLTEEGDYTFVITPNTILVDGKLLLEQHITYHLTAITPVIEPFKLTFDSKVTDTDQLHFHIPDDIEFCGLKFSGGTPIYDGDNNKAGKVYDFKQTDDKHFYLILRMDTGDTEKTYHFDINEGFILGRSASGDIPSAAATVVFNL